MKERVSHYLAALELCLKEDPFGNEVNELTSILRRRHYAESKDEMNDLLKKYKNSAPVDEKSVLESSKFAIRQPTNSETETKKKAQPSETKGKFQIRQTPTTPIDKSLNVSIKKRETTPKKSVKDVALEIEPKVLYNMNDKELASTLGRDTDVVRAYVEKHELGSIRPQVKKFDTALVYLLEMIEEKVMKITADTIKVSDEEE